MINLKLLSDIGQQNSDQQHTNDVLQQTTAHRSPTDWVKKLTPFRAVNHFVLFLLPNEQNDMISDIMTIE